MIFFNFKVFVICTQIKLKTLGYPNKNYKTICRFKKLSLINNYLYVSADLICLNFSVVDEKGGFYG
ncbi:hypothetical protein DWW69_02505 [Bacteroides sp. AF16-49]|nr:hypothetical protein DXB63_14860 [Bacteroides sp. OM05-12]RHR82266.1 hypothetical protein DWW69_02505 [Bacteroides sp. AF16-49]